MSDAGVKSGGIRLTKEERKELLAQLERQSSRAESPERILQRGQQALEEGQLDRARRLRQQLETAAPHLTGLDLFKRNVDAALAREKRLSNLRATEEMLSRYIQQRKKPLAELALETLVEIAPAHPRRADYEHWVADLDQEVKIQRRIEEQLAAGRVALRADDLAKAAKHLEALHKIDPHSTATEQLAAEVAGAEQGQAASAGIERAKEHLEELLANDRLDEAEEQMEQLGRMDIPKVTVDFLRKRLEQSRRRLRDQAEGERLVAELERYLEGHDWPRAREVAQRFSRKFPSSPRATELFNRINDLEAAERRRQSIREGLAAIEQFISAGERHNAEVAIRLLAGLEVGEERLARLQARLDEIPEG